MMLTVARHPTGVPLQTLLEGMIAAPVQSGIHVQGISSDSRDIREGDFISRLPGYENPRQPVHPGCLRLRGGGGGHG